MSDDILSLSLDEIIRQQKQKRPNKNTRNQQGGRRNTFHMRWGGPRRYRNRQGGQLRAAGLTPLVRDARAERTMRNKYIGHRIARQKVQRAYQVLNRRRYNYKPRRFFPRWRFNYSRPNRGQRFRGFMQDRSAGSFRSDHITRQANVGLQSQGASGDILTVKFANDRARPLSRANSLSRSASLMSLTSVNTFNTSVRGSTTFNTSVRGSTTFNTSVRGSPTMRGNMRGLNPRIQREIACIQGKSFADFAPSVDGLSTFRPTPGITVKTLHQRFSEQ